MELTLDQALQKGIEAHKAGKAQEADQYYTAILKAQPKHPDANHNMGVLAVGVGKAEAALPFFKTALEANSSIVQYWLSYIDTLIKLGRIDDAKAVCEQAKSNGVKDDGFVKLEKRLGSSENKNPKVQNPPKEQLDTLMKLYNQNRLEQVFNKAQLLTKQYTESVVLWNLLGASAAQIGQGEQAVFAFNKILSIKPDYADAYNNLGNALKNQGKIEEAIEAYNKILSIKPHTDAYYNMGIALQEQGKLEEAIEAYNNAISINPNYADAYNNLGVTLKDQGKLEEAIEAYNKAIYIKPDYAEAYNNIGLVLKGIIFKKPNGALQKTIVSLLDTGRYVRPSEIFRAAISLLKFEPTLQKYLQLGDDEIMRNSLVIISDLSELSLLRKLMNVCPLPDLELEKLLTKLRCSILSYISSLKEASPKLLGFQSALALQCFTNEYIYGHTKEEAKILQALDKIVKKTLKNNKQPSPQIVLALASYKALNQYKWHTTLVVTDEIKEVFIRQVEEPNEEEKLKQNLPVLEEITDGVSSKVRAQYEESPYPRWVNLGLSFKPFSIREIVDQIKLKLHDNKITEVKKPDILIAGCGTGQHSIGTAARFKGSNVLAIDLSLSSLAYANRKTEELGIENINHLNADILDLKQLNKQFDIIESTGVLHHMDNPMAGWKVLTNCLRPGGLMRIGLYSELARKHIVKIRREISQKGIGSSKTQMKAFRDTVIKSAKDHHKLIIYSPDFYSLSTLRDLLFHIQEHRFTILLLQEHLDKLGLTFCGFEAPEIVSNFKQTNKAKDDLYNFDKWQAYEEANPQAFAGMYQFWCQKAK